MTPTPQVPIRISIATALAFALTSVVTTGATPAAAEATGGFDQPRSYFEFSSGPAFIPKQTLRDGATGMSRIESDTGFYVGGALGTQLFDQFRGELQLSYRQGDSKKAAVVGPATRADGRISLLSLMLNAYYDVDLGLPVIPYIGAGIGWGQFQLDIRQKTVGTLDIDDHDDVFVYNAMVGALVPVSQVASLSVGYRYVGAEGTKSIGGVVGSVSQEIRAEFDSHELTMGLRFHF